MATVLQKARDLFQGKSIQINNNSLVGKLLGFGENLGRRITDASLAGFGARGNVVGSAQYIGKVLGNEQTGQDAGFALRGALSLTPFQAVTPQQKQFESQSNPVNLRQKAFQSVGQGLYGSALTAPLAGGALGAVKNMVVGTGLGLGMGTGAQLLSGGGLPSKQQTTEYALSGLQNSWVLPITNKVTDLFLGKLAPNLVGSNVTDPFKQGQIKQGFARLFTRALAEVPAENTAFTALNRLDNQSKEAFISDWMENLPGNVLTNLAFAGVGGTFNTAFEKESRKVITNALKETVRKWSIPVKFYDEHGKKIVMSLLEYRLRNQPGFADLNYKFGDTQPTKGVSGVDLPPPPSTSQGLESVGNILSQQEGLTNKGIKPQQPNIQKPQLGGAGQSNGTSIPNIDPVQKIINALKEAKPLNQEQRNIYSKIRSQQAGALGGIGEQMGGEAGYFKKLGQLKGELPKVQFESIRKNLSQGDINTLFNKVEQSNLGTFEKVNAQTGLRKLLGEQGGAVPTKSELALLNEVFPPEFIQAVLDNRSTFQKLLSVGESVLNLPRAVMATADFSAPLRQGIFLIGRPRQWLPAFKEQFKYFANPKAYEGLMDDIRSRPNYKLYREAGLSLTDMSPVLGSREEAFMSNLVERIPGFGKLAAGSNRAYTGFLNKLRVDVFDDLVKSAKSQGVNLEGKALQDIAKFVNSATGRGDLGALQKAAPILNATLFSPRLVASRVNLLNPAFYVKLDPFARKEALKSLLTFGGTALTVLGLAKLAGAEVGADPRSSDFGKIKTGNTRYDVLGGFQQYIKLASQLISGQIVSSTTGKTITLGEGYKPMTRKDILVRFFESKESPVASLVTGLLSGKTGLGEDFKLSEELVSRFIPLIAQDLYSLTKEYGASGVLRGVPGLFGIGSQTYGKQEVVTGKNALGKPDVQIKPTTGLAEDIVAKLGGQREIGSTPQYSADAYYKQLKQMPKDQAKAKLLEIAKINPDVAKKILTAMEDEKKGITVKDKELQAKGVKNGERAIAIVKQLNKIKEKEKKKAYLLELVKKGVVNEEVLQQVLGAIKK